MCGLDGWRQRSYRARKEGKAPDSALETLPPSSCNKDLDRTRRVRARLGVRESFLFDPSGGTSSRCSKGASCTWGRCSCSHLRRRKRGGDLSHLGCKIVWPNRVVSPPRPGFPLRDPSQPCSSPTGRAVHSGPAANERPANSIQRPPLRTAVRPRTALGPVSRAADPTAVRPRGRRRRTRKALAAQLAPESCRRHG